MKGRVWLAGLALIVFSIVLCTAQADTLMLPDEITVIEAEAFEGDSALDQVILPEGIKRIESRAFANSSVQSVYLPASLEYVAGDAFAGCQARAEGPGIFYSEGLIYETSPAGDFTFQTIDETTCRIKAYIGTETAVIVPPFDPEGRRVVEIGQNAFRNKKAVQSVELPETVMTIGRDAFFMCSGLTEIQLPSGLTELGERAFYETGITGITIPEGITELEESVFAYCENLESVNLPETLTTIRENAFLVCEKLNHVVIPDSVRSIHRNAFSVCSGITEITLPIDLEAWFIPYLEDQIQVIHFTKGRTGYENSGILRHCWNIRKITYGEGIISIDPEVTMESEYSDPGDPYGYTAEPEHMVPDLSFETLREVSFPDSLEMIFSGFNDAPALTSISLPGNMSTISGSFNQCGLTSVTFRSGQGENTLKIWGSFYEGMFDSLVLPENTREIKNSFYHSPIEALVLPKGIQTISGAFDGALIHELNLEDYYQLDEIISSFRNCNNLTSVTLPDTLPRIESAFSDNPALTEVRLPNADFSHSSCFMNCPEIRTLELPADFTVGNQYVGAFRQSTKIEKIRYTLRYGEMGTFDGTLISVCAASLREIEIPEGITAIPDYIFTGCSNLEKLTLPSSLLSIGRNNFKDTTKLGDMYLRMICEVNETAFAGSSATLYVTDAYPSIILSATQEEKDGATELKLYIDDQLPGDNSATFQIQQSTHFGGPYTANAASKGGDTVGKYLQCTITGNFDGFVRIQKEFTTYRGVHWVYHTETTYWNSSTVSEEALTAILKQIGRDHLESSIHNYVTPDDMVSTYYASNLSIADRIVDFAEDFINGHYDDIFMVDLNKEAYLIDTILKGLAGDIKAELVKPDPNNTNIMALNKIRDFSEDEYFLYLLDKYGEEDSVLQNTLSSENAFRDLFDDYVEDKVMDKDLPQRLEELFPDDTTRTAISKAFDTWKFLKTLRYIREICKGMQLATSIAGGAIDIYNQYMFIEAIGSQRLLRAAEIYKKSSDPVVWGVGQHLEIYALVDKLTRLQMIIGGEISNWGIGELINTAFKETLDQNGFVTVKLAATVVNAFSGVDKLPNLKDHVEWASQAVYQAWDAFSESLAQYDQSGTDENLELAYHDYILYYGLAAQAEEAMMKLYEGVEKGLMGRIMMSRNDKQVLENLKKTCPVYKSLSDTADMYHELWVTGDLAQFRATMAALQRQ